MDPLDDLDDNTQGEPLSLDTDLISKAFAHILTQMFQQDTSMTGIQIDFLDGNGSLYSAELTLELVELKGPLGGVH